MLQLSECLVVLLVLRGLSGRKCLQLRVVTVPLGSEPGRFVSMLLSLDVHLSLETPDHLGGLIESGVLLCRWSEPLGRAA